MNKKNKVINPRRRRRRAGDYSAVLVADFMYLGARLTNKNDELVAVQAQIQAASRTCFSIFSLMRCHDICW
jgi:hypothetical protein